MALINCPECSHPMSDKAKVCPNCFVPRKIAELKKCKDCGFEMEPPKRKCPECGALQTNSENSKKNTPMKTASKNESTFNWNAVYFLIAGALIMYVIAVQFKIFDKKTLNSANVERLNGLYVFIESAPANEYDIIQTVKGENLADIYNKIGLGKQKAGNVLLNIINAANQNLNFNQVIDIMTTNVHSNFKEADGVIFHDHLKECEVIKFKKTIN